MLFKQIFLKALAAGEVDLAFRRWERPRVKLGSQLRTAIGVLEVTDVRVVAVGRITTREAERAGFPSRAALLQALDDGREGKVHRVTLRLAGEDPRIALRARKTLSAAEAAEIQARLDRFDAASRHGAWTERVLELIARHPGRRAPDLAQVVGRETRLFKTDVRKLKELGLTESLDVGYRLSPRGQAWRKRGRR